MTTTTTTAKTTICLSDSGPISIVTADWPIIASASWHSGSHECQANEVASVRVRAHADGRTIVYASRDRGPGGMPLGYRGKSAGFLVAHSREHIEPQHARIIASIRRVAGAIGMPDLGSEAIADLPAVEVQ